MPGDVGRKNYGHDCEGFPQALVPCHHSIGFERTLQRMSLSMKAAKDFCQKIVTSFRQTDDENASDSAVKNGYGELCWC